MKDCPSTAARGQAVRCREAGHPGVRDPPATLPFGITDVQHAPQRWHDHGGQQAHDHDHAEDRGRDGTHAQTQIGDDQPDSPRGAMPIVTMATLRRACRASPGHSDHPRGARRVSVGSGVQPARWRPRRRAPLGCGPGSPRAEHLGRAVLNRVLDTWSIQRQLRWIALVRHGTLDHVAARYRLRHGARALPLSRQSDGTKAVPRVDKALGERDLGRPRRSASSHTQQRVCQG